MMITTTLVKKIAVELAGLVRTPTEWYANGSKAEDRKVIDKRSQLHWNATFSFGFIFFVGSGNIRVLFDKRKNQ